MRIRIRVPRALVCRICGNNRDRIGRDGICDTCANRGDAPPTKSTFPLAA